MRQNITPAEMEILQYILDYAPVTVRTVADHFAQTKGLARTTILSVMEHLRQKGHLKREEGSTGYLYSPGLPKAEIQRNLIVEFIERSLGGSLSPFVAYLAEREVFNEAERQEVNRLLNKLKEIDQVSDKASDKSAERGEEQ